jgi:hypothetical protein
MRDPHSSVRSPKPGLKLRGGGDVEEGGGGAEDRYATLYEHKISPFAQFTTDERDRKMSELNVADRIVYVTATQVISSKAGRTVLTSYLAGAPITPST